MADIIPFPAAVKVRVLIDVKPIHQALAGDIVNQAIAADMLPQGLLKMIGLRFAGGHPSWQYVIGKLAYEIACNNYLALNLVSKNS